jgi:hypothetical protein
MDTESFSCLSWAPGASQADGQNNGEDGQQSQAALQLANKGLELVKFNDNNNVPINVAVSLAVVEGDIELQRVVKIPSDHSPICPRYPAAWLSLCTT